MARPMVINMKKLSDSTLDSKLVDPTIYKQLIGSMMYLVNTRPYIFFMVSTLSQFMVELRHVHWVVAKRVLRYLHGTVGYGLRYVSGSEVNLQGYPDYYQGGSVVYRKSTFGCFFSLGSTMISQFSRKHIFLELSTIEVEYIVLSVIGHEVMRLWKILVGLFDQELEMILIQINIIKAMLRFQRIQYFIIGRSILRSNIT